MAFPTAEVLTQRLTPLLATHGLDVEHVKATPAGKKSQVVVRVDGDTRPSSDLLEVVSDEISTFFDGLEAAGELNFGAGYTLEVSTPGVDLPLTLPRHFRRNRGRRIEAGRLGALSPDETSVILVNTVKKDVVISERRIEDLAGQVVEIEFAKAPEAELAATELEYLDAAEKAIRED
ncbi:ribosome maturation factor RimP [uncultured Corynebacterium sp.]|uniref:ribosome maturation factor RimP n=1 Tax=uncultured Corynebacterium sp. TaxID=159447 RepID=UPI0025D7479E|nr:ribosome maturation factor RimP [uncultured Corynebacterium sp.]